MRRPASVRELLPEVELERIRVATREAESHTSGEIVVSIVESCDTYEGALWRSAAAGAMLAGVLSAVLRATLGGWSIPSWLWLALPPVMGAALGFGLPWISPWLHRLLIGREVLDRRVARRAAVAFVDEGVFGTRHRTGVLFFVGLFEHRVEILRDLEPEQRVPSESWDDLSHRLAKSIRKGDLVAALAKAVEDCGRLMELHGLDRQSDDVNELPDLPRLHDE